MTQCTRDDMRDLLPDLLHERLDAATRAEVTRHLAACAECRAELELLRSMRSALAPAPRVDVRRIAAAVAAARGASAEPGVRPLGAARDAPARRRIAWRIAAGFVVAALGVTTWILSRQSPYTPPVVAGAPQHTDSPPPAPQVVAAHPPTLHHPTSATKTPAAPQMVASRGLVMDGGVTDLSDGDMRQLLQSLDSLTAMPDADPAPMNYQLDDDGGAR